MVRGGNVFGFVDKTGSSNDKGGFGLMYGGLRGVVTLGTLGDTPGDTPNGVPGLVYTGKRSPTVGSGGRAGTLGRT